MKKLKFATLYIKSIFKYWKYLDHHIRTSPEWIEINREDIKKSLKLDLISYNTHTSPEIKEKIFREKVLSATPSPIHIKDFIK
jgi:hypothetical protein